MLPVNFLKKEKKAQIIFNTEFYDMYPVTEVCEKFQHICKILVEYNKDKREMKITMKPKVDIDLKEVVLEFCNWVLHLQVKGV